MVALVLVAAVAENGVIGRANALPWRLNSDRAHFRALTLGYPVVMGRKTYQSIGAPLAGRTNIVVSRDCAFSAPRILVAGSLDQALSAARGDALRRGAEAIMVVGGTEIYAQTMPAASRLEITCVHAKPEGDTVFPAIDPAQWRETTRKQAPMSEGDTAAFTFVTYERVPSGAGNASLGSNAVR